jgi:hypothetical protein
MLVIKADQISAIEDTQLDGFVQRAQAFIREHFPDVAEAYGPLAIDRYARQAVGRGALYDMPAEKHVTQLLVLMLLHGADFDVDLPQADRLQRELGAGERSPDERLERVFALLAHDGGVTTE